MNGSRIKMRRKELGLSVDDVAQKIGKDRATVYRYESDYIDNLPYIVIGKLSDVLKCSPAFLMGFTDDPEIKNTATITTDNDGIEMTDRDKLMLILFDQLDDEKKEVLIRTMKDLLNSQK